MTDEACDHPDFGVHADVNRLTDVEGGPVERYSMDVRVVCVACGESFVFIGTPTGWSPRQPATSIDGSEVHLPIRPASAPPGWGEDGPGFAATFEPKPGRQAN